MSNKIIKAEEPSPHKTTDAIIECCFPPYENTFNIARYFWSNIKVHAQ